VPLVVSSYAAFLVSFVFSCIYLLKYYAERSFEGKSVLTAAAAGGDGSTTMTVGATPLEFSGTIRRDTPALSAAAANGNPVALWFNTLPTLPQLDVIVYRAVAIGLPLITIGIVTGAMWAKESWGAYWQWDPKETAALASWIVYLCYMHLHTRSAWRGLRTNWVSVGGFLTIMFCYFGVNLWISGLHSYKM
jgi:cytochrome c-type biogenesis protein CcsB